jgi:hypothetical protein
VSWWSVLVVVGEVAAQQIGVISLFSSERDELNVYVGTVWCVSMTLLRIKGGSAKYQKYSHMYV